MMNFIFGMQINIEVFYKLILLSWVYLTRHVQSTQVSISCNISGTAWGVKLIFCLQINTKIFDKLIVSLWVCMVNYAQSTQNNKFTISLQYFKKNMKDGVDFLPADRLQRFLQSDTIILDVCGQSCPNYPK